jgi:hypothetical protein
MQINPFIQPLPARVQENVQQNADQNLRNSSSGKQRTELSETSQNETANFQKLAQNILEQRASGEVTQKPAIERGQVLNILV